jgi:hypothetical protein
MKKFNLIFTAFLTSIALSSYAQEDVWVNTSSGGYYRTAPNSTNIDNYSTRGNINPYTGEAGTITPNYYQNSALSSLNSLLSQPVYNLPSGTSISSHPKPEIYLPRPSTSTYQPDKVTDTQSNPSPNKGGKYFNIIDGKKNYVKQTISRL